MRDFVWSQFRFRRHRALVLGLAIVVAAVSFVLLTSGAKSSSLQIRGTLKSNFRPAYDILVRPRGSKTSLERQRGLVPPNYLSGIFGGISLREWRQVLTTRGVEVAAPIANIGYVLAFDSPQVPLGSYLTQSRASDLSRSRVLARVQWPLVVSRSGNGLRLCHQESRRLRPLSRPHRVCRPRQDVVSLRGLLCLWGNSSRRREPSPFSPSSGLTCFSTSSPDADGPVSENTWRGEKTVGVAEASYFPLLLSAIDPTQEARLVHLPRTVVSGRYLRENDDARFDNRCLVCNTVIPVLVGTETYLDEPLVVKVARLKGPGTTASCLL